MRDLEVADFRIVERDGTYGLLLETAQNRAAQISSALAPISPTERPGRRMRTSSSTGRWHS